MKNNQNFPLCVKLVLALWVFLALLLLVGNLAAFSSDNTWAEQLDILASPVLLLGAAFYVWRASKRR